MGTASSVRPSQSAEDGLAVLWQRRWRHALRRRRPDQPVQCRSAPARVDPAHGGDERVVVVRVAAADRRRRHVRQLAPRPRSGSRCGYRRDQVDLQPGFASARKPGYLLRPDQSRRGLRRRQDLPRSAGLDPRGVGRCQRQRALEDQHRPVGKQQDRDAGAAVRGRQGHCRPVVRRVLLPRPCHGVLRGRRLAVVALLHHPWTG